MICSATLYENGNTGLFDSEVFVVNKYCEKFDKLLKSDFQIVHILDDLAVFIKYFDVNTALVIERSCKTPYTRIKVI